MPSREDYARAFVRQGGYDPNSPQGRRRVNAILVASKVCETYPQFTRAAQAALEPEFGSFDWQKEMSGPDLAAVSI